MSLQFKFARINFSAVDAFTAAVAKKYGYRYGLEWDAAKGHIGLEENPKNSFPA